MTILQIEVATREAITERILAAATVGEPQPPSYAFETEADLLSTLNPNRGSILKALTGAGPLGVLELARRVGREVKGVHTDAQRLLRCGLVDKTEDGRLHLPYDEVRLALVARTA